VPIYENECSKCGAVDQYYNPHITEETRPCPKCGGETERLYSLAAIHMFQPFTTRNLDPSGKPVTVHSQRELSSLCHEYGVQHVPDFKVDPPGTKPTVKMPAVPNY
jgi:putative FmdB family regulatory protein